ncbi:unnamed protein product [Closterium sp. Yama58-4]|nr:unnamed protein product [Closterium sp. Yama58-4]
MRSNITANDKLFLGRAWGNYSRVVISYSFVDNVIATGGWYDWGDPERQLTSYFAEDTQGRWLAKLRPLVVISSPMASATNAVLSLPAARGLHSLVSGGCRHDSQVSLASVRSRDRVNLSTPSRRLASGGAWNLPSFTGSARLCSRLSVAAVAAGQEASADGGAVSEVEKLKDNILRLVAPLDRGIAASQQQAKEVEAAVALLELAAAPLDFSPPPPVEEDHIGGLAIRARAEGKALTGGTDVGAGVGGISRGVSRDLAMLDGTWRLVYSSGFVSGSLGGLRPGPPAGGPVSIGQVTQRVDVTAKELDNIVELRVSAPWPLPALEATASLQHTFQLTGPSSIRIIFESTAVRPSGSFPPPFTVPQLPAFLRPPPEVRSGDFRTTYLDGDFRISRGDRGEVRVFVRA